MSTPPPRVRGDAHSGEFALIERHFARVPRAADVRRGVGDDGAVVSPAAGLDYVMTVDMLVEGRHFAPDADPVLLGHKTLAVNLSDLAAMGAKPRFALLAGALPSADSTWLSSFMRGFDALARRYEVDLIGGDTTRGPLTLCVTAIGELPTGSAITRRGARAGDIVYVSGRLGDAALALAAANGRIEIEASLLMALHQRLDAPEPRVALGLALRGIASSAIDVSDGLTGDLGHILDASHVGATIDVETIPCGDMLRSLLRGENRELALECLLAGGDDYELCFTARATMRPRIDALAGALRLPLTAIGTIRGEQGLVILDDDGRPLPSPPRAFDHFA